MLARSGPARILLLVAVLAGVLLMLFGHWSGTGRQPIQRIEPTEGASEQGTSKTGPLEAAPQAVDRSVAEVAAHDAASSDAPSHGLLTVIVLDTRRVPLPSARVQVFAGGGKAEERARAETDDSGSCAVPRSDCVRVVVSAAGHETASLGMPPPEQDSLEVMLPAGASISGRVLDGRTGGPVAARVVGWPDRLVPPPPDLVERGLRGDAGVLFAESRDDGNFALLGVRRGESYTLMAARPSLDGGPALALPAPVSGRLAGAVDLQLELQPLYGMEVRLRDRNAGRLTLDPRRQMPARDPGEALQVTGATYLYQPSFALELAGLDDAPRYGTPGTYLYLFTASSGTAAVGPMAWSLQLPEWKVAAEQFWIPPVTNTLHVEEVIYSGPAQSGSVAVNVKAPAEAGLETDSGEPSSSSTLPSGVIFLSGEAGLFKYVVSTKQRGPLVLSGLPYGRYGILFGATSSAFQYPAPDAPEEFVTVGARPAEWRLDLSASASVRLEVLRPDGNAYSGRITLLRLEGLAESEGQSLPGGFETLDGPPFELFPLPPGPWMMRLVSPSSATPGGWLTAKLERGRRTVLQLTLASD